MKKSTYLTLLIFCFLGVMPGICQELQKIPEEVRVIKEKGIEDYSINQILSSKGYQEINSGKVDFKATNYGNPPELNWFGQFGGSSEDVASDIVSDSLGNVYVCGYFSDEIQIAGNMYYSVGIYDGILIKLDHDGTVNWVKQIPASVNESLKINALSFDGNQLYITGSYTGTLTIGGTDLTDYGGINLFFVKLDTDGNIQLAGGHDNAGIGVEGEKIDYDSLGNIYLVSTILSTNQTILLKYNSNGTLNWEQTYNLIFEDLKVVDTCIYFVGTNNGYSETLTGGVIVNPPSYYSDIFFAKSNLDGTFSWAKMLSHVSPSGYTRDPVFSVDNSENIYLVGYYRNDILFEDDTLVNAYAYDRFLAKYDRDGNYLWSNNVNVDNNYSFCDATVYDNNLYLISPEIIKIFDSSGEEQLERKIFFTVKSISVNSFNKIVLAGNRSQLIRITQSDLNFNEIWNLQTNGSAVSGHVVDMITDDENNVYTFGSLSNNAEFLGTNIQKGLFLAKQNSLGDLLWLKQFGYELTLQGDIGYQLYLDSIRSHIYLTGELNAELIIPGESTLVPIDGGSIFFLKFDTDGNYILSHQEDFNGSDLSLVTDYSGNIIWTGTFAETINIGTEHLVSAGSRDAFICKYEPDGNFLWANRVGGEDIEYLLISISDTSDNLYLTGEAYSDSLDVADGYINHSQGDGHILFAKLDSDGHCKWIKYFGNSNTNFGEYYCWPTGIMMDDFGDIIIKGWHGDSIYFDNFLLTNPHYHYSKFLAKIDTAGNAIWAKSINETMYGFEYNQFDTDKDGNIYFGMQATDTLYFEDDFVYVPYGKDLVVIKYSKQGELIWVKPIEGNNYYSRISSVKINNTGNVFVGGYFTDSLTIDKQVFISYNQYNGFVIILGDDVYPPTANIICNSPVICEGDSVLISIEFTGEAPWTITFSDGVTNTEIITSNNPYTFYTKKEGTYEIIALKDKNYSGTYFGNRCSVSVLPLPNAGFLYEIDELTVSFTNTSSNANNYLWDFGDGLESPAYNPVHSYLNFGNYNVELSAISEKCGTATEILEIYLSTTDVEDINNLKNRYFLYPNPTNGNFRFEINDVVEDKIILEILNTSGQVIYNKKFLSTNGIVKGDISLKKYPEGLYFVRVRSESGYLGTIKLLITK